MTFHVKLPIFVARQWVRHRTARLNEVSGRYSVMPDEFYVPRRSEIRRQSRGRRQNRSEEELPSDVQAHVLNVIQSDQASVYGTYEGMIADGVARELARINLPLSLYTQWYWQIDLHNLFHFLELRLNSDAQLEIREYGAVLAMMAKAVAPNAYEAFEEHVLYAVRLSKSKKSRLLALLRSTNVDPSVVSELSDILKDSGLEQSG